MADALRRNLLDVDTNDIRPPTVGDGVLVLTVVLVVPILLYVANLAPIERLLYPATNLAVALYLFARRSPWYTGQTVLLFCFVSLVRRLVDAQSGFDPQNPILLTPNLCGLLAAIEFLNYWLRRQPRNLGPFLIILLAIAYGSVLAIVSGRFMAGLIDFLKWGFGPTFAVFILSQGSGQLQTRKVVEGCLVWAGTAMALYGICQFIQPTPWDTLWANSVIDSGMESLGHPAPFELRAFSTMNSPGSFGAIMCCAILIALKRKLSIALPAASLMAIGLAIAQYRAIWAATVLGVVLIILSRPRALRPANILAAGLVALALASTALVPGIRDALIQRAASLNSLSTDDSFESRLSQYERLSSDDQLIGGIGLGLNGSTRKMDDLPRVVIDSGLIEILRSIGLVGGTAYLLALGVLVVRLFRREPSVAHHVDFDRALVVATFVQLPMGSVQIGEIGFCAWMYIGFGLATLSAAYQKSRRPQTGVSPAPALTGTRT
jgi:hypothetical protein